MTSLASAKAAKSPTLRRSSQPQGPVAMSREKRLPRELLARIGINGKEVVKILRARGWDIIEPHGLQQQKLYYLPGVLQKVETSGYESRQHRDFFVGEGELYAFILREGGLAFLLPDEVTLSSASASENELSVQQSEPSAEVTKPRNLERSDARTWKRRKKLSTARRSLTHEEALNSVNTAALERPVRSKLAAEVAAAGAEVAAPAPAPAATVQHVAPLSRPKKPSVKCEVAATWTAATSAAARPQHQETEWSDYQQSLRARGWRAQLLQDLDVQLLRATAAVDRRLRAHDLANSRRVLTDSKSTQSGGPHVVDAFDSVQEMDALLSSIRASQEDLSRLMEAVITEGEQQAVVDRVDPVGRIGIPAFVSTGMGARVLLRDLERYLLLFVAAVRRYERARNNRRDTGYCARGNVLVSSLSRAVERRDLRALQVTIEESKRELQELAGLVAADIVKTCQDEAWPSAAESSSPRSLQRSPQATSPSPTRATCRSTEGDAERETGRDQLFSQQNVASPRLEGGQWFV